MRPGIKLLTKLKHLFLKSSTRSKAIVFAFIIVGTVVLIRSYAATEPIAIEPELSTNRAGCVKTINDSLAANGAAVEFNPLDGCGLDHSGLTIPANNYARPSNAVYMSPAGSDKNSTSVDGNDNNSGSEGSPVRTITKAISLVPENGTIVMRGGEYRDWHANSAGTMVRFETKSFILQAYPTESPWFNGADVVSTEWVSVGSGRWSRTWDTPNFCGPGQYYVPVQGDKPPFSPTLTLNPAGMTTACVYGESVKDSPNVAGDPQNVFINNKKLSQVPTLAQVTSNTFFYDWTAKKMYIGQDPAGKKVELAKRSQAFMLNKGNYAIKGIGFKNYASGGTGGGNWTGHNTVFLNEPASSLIENSVFVDNAYIGLGYSQPRNNKSRVTNSVFAHNGYAGISGNGSRSVSGRDDFVVEGNVFNGNNAELYDTKCAATCGSANIKLNNMVGVTMKNNVVENSKGKAYGLWCDVHCSEAVIVNNVSKNNGNNGIFYEISKNGIIANNLVVDNAWDGISVTSANVKIYNNTVIFDRSKSSVARGIHIFDDGRCSICYNDPGIGPDTRGIELMNNVVVARAGGEVALSVDERQTYLPNATPSTTTNTKASQFYDKFDYNAYHRVAASDPFYIWRPDNNPVSGQACTYGQNPPPGLACLKTRSAFTALTGWEGNAIDFVGGSDPFFVNKDAGDFRIRTNSPAYNTGQPLPQDVATAAGLPAGVQIPRGAINWSDL